MPTNITINDITGTTPFDIYICNSGLTTCIYVDTINNTSFPYDFQIPSIIEGQLSYKLKVVDDDGCIKILTLTL